MTVRGFALCSSILTLALWVGCPAPAGDDDSSHPGDDDDAAGCEQTYEGHQACNDEYGFLYFCGDDGACVEASGCAAEECCVPGAGGDQWCEATFGEGSVCAVVGDDGQCS